MLQPPLSPKDEKTAPVPDGTTEQPIKDLSPELIAAIAERVKKEVVEHLKQSANAEDDQKMTPLQPAVGDSVKKPKKTATVEDEPEAPAMQQQPSNKSQSSNSSPPPIARRVYTPPSPIQASRSANTAAPRSESSRSPPRSPSEKPSGARFSDRPLPRPSPGRAKSKMEQSNIDLKWGKLFDSEGNPTQKLGQYLIDLANYIIKEYPDKKCILVTPSKMAQYYSKYPVDNEIYPLVSIFQSNKRIAQLYQYLGCEYRMVQDNPSDPPITPALTSVGFAYWKAIYILAYPEVEAKRLEKVVLALPIYADKVSQDGEPERLPRQLLRYLLPQKGDLESRTGLKDAMNNFFRGVETSPRQKLTIIPSPPQQSPSAQSRSRPVDIHQVKTAPIVINTKPAKGERKQSSSVSESSGQIERHRQPYTAQPGSGKIYTESSSFNTPPGPEMQHPLPRRPKSPTNDWGKKEREERRYTANADKKMAEFNGPRDADKWDRMRNYRFIHSNKEGRSRTPVIVDPGNAKPEDWYRGQGGQTSY